MKPLRFTALLFLFATALRGNSQSAPGYDVILLVGQSNMVGYGTAPDNSADAAVNPRVSMWNSTSNTIVPAKDPLIHNQVPGYVGPGLTFAKAYLASLPANRNVLLVGAARGATGFNNGWLIPNSGGDSSLSTTAVAWANNAMAAAGSGAKFAGILWDQGEADVIAAGTYPANYQTNLVNLIHYFRSNITGATAATPFVVTELNYFWMIGNYNPANEGNGYSQSWIAPEIQVQRALHTLPDLVNNTAWTDAAVLSGDAVYTAIHFSALAQRQLGRRDADRFFEAQTGLPQPQTQLVWSDGYFIDEGRSFLDSYPFNYFPGTNGTVAAIADPARGNVAQITQGKGFLTVNVPSTTFNGSYTKMAWFNPGASGYYNNLVSGNIDGQAHYLLAANFGNNQLVLVGGHSNGSTVPFTVSATVSAPAKQWENIALVYDAAVKTMTLFYNGSVVYSAANVPLAPQVTATGTLPLDFGSFGQNADGSSISGVDGLMGGTRVWTGALTAAQIAALYQHELLYRAGF